MGSKQITIKVNSQDQKHQKKLKPKKQSHHNKKLRIFKKVKKNLKIQKKQMILKMRILSKERPKILISDHIFKFIRKSNFLMKIRNLNEEIMPIRLLTFDISCQLDEKLFVILNQLKNH